MLGPGCATAPVPTLSSALQAIASAAAASGSPICGAHPLSRKRREDLVGNPDAVRRRPDEGRRTPSTGWPLGGAPMKFGFTRQ